MPTTTEFMASIEAVEDIGAVHGSKLRAAGRSTGALAKASATPAGRKVLASKTGLSKRQILEWANRCDLMRVKGVGEEYSDLLEAAGVSSVKVLRGRDARSLHRKLGEVNAAKNLVRRPPALPLVERWIAHARLMTDPIPDAALLRRAGGLE